MSHIFIQRAIQQRVDLVGFHQLSRFHREGVGVDGARRARHHRVDARLVQVDVVIQRAAQVS